MSHVKALGTTNNRLKRQLKIGFAGPCPPTTFDEALAEQLINETLDRIVADHVSFEYALVSGHTDVGALKLAYKAASDRGWWTIGIASTKAKEHPLFDVDEKISNPAWTEWGSESERFVEEFDVLFVLGDGPQGLREARQAEKLGKRVYPVEMPTVRAS